MSGFKITAALGAVSFLLGVDAHPSSPSASTYAVKERHNVPGSWTRLGAAEKSDLINLQIGLRQSNQGSIEQHLIEVSDPEHERYGEHLTAAEVADIVRPAKTTISSVHDWLMKHGVGDVAYSPAEDWISIVVPVSKAEELLQTTYSKFQHRDGHVANRAPEWSLPVHLHEHIDVIQPTTSFLTPKAELKPVRSKLSQDEKTWWETSGRFKYGHGGAPTPPDVSGICNATFVTLDCLRTLYGTLNYTAKAAKKNSVAINNYLNETNRRDDAKKFLQTFRPEAVAAADEFQFVIIDNAPNYQGPNLTEFVAADADVEGNLDAQLVLGISYPTPLTAFSTGGSPPFLPSLSTPTDTNEPYLAFLNFVLAEDKLPLVFSSSYGDDEQSVPQSYATRVCAGFAQLGARGITYFVSSGDAGVGSDDTCFSNDGKNTTKFTPDFPTSCPWVTSVGATANFNPETAVTRFASGAGFSNYFGAPKYQQKVVQKYIASLNGTYDGLYNKTGRAYPDLSAQGNEDVIIYAGNVIRVGGTSASSPTVAGIFALVNDALLAAGKKPLGFINPWLYSKAYKTFTDVTIGSSFGCNTDGFPAQAGWDAVTGFGTPNFGALVKAALKK
ncbi:Protease KEX1 [Sphaceloma murrayae]|uniref:tripeptidyl-peptidase II n=1 Tax=Sphaceloma murrayae TaxID=2082308 RepID=A0A2K1QNP2_9PEZI|nr:Protease KEX1 [Sphaceloma murrayae]